MAPIPPLTPSSPDTPGARVPTRTRSSIADEIAHGTSSAEIILAKLRGMVAGGKQDTDTILGTIAVAAHALTGSNGAAIAMPRGGGVVCIGRSGEIAPELGDRLNINSGISGECLRTGTIMRCDDAARDFHVNPEVCRQMGVQSIAVVPLRGQRGRVGVLEAFSSRSYAFSDEHMELLGRLAGLAESAWARTHQEETAATEEALPTEDFSAPMAATPGVIESDVIAERLIAEVRIEGKRVSQKPIAAAASSASVGRAAAVRVQPAVRTTRRTTRTEQWWRYATISGLAGVLVILLAIFSWRAWYKASLPVSSSKSADTSQDNASETSDATGSEVIQEAAAKPVARPSAVRTAPRSSAPASRSDVEIRRLPVASPAPDLSHANTTTAAADSNAPVSEPPQIPEPDAKPTTVATLLTAPAALPSLKTTNTESFAGGVLVHKVLPVYPTQARQARIQGNVVLEAIISEQGQIENLKVVSGPTILAPAAVEAVRQWRYTPYLLNGKPIKKQTQINISFIAAQ